EIRGARPARPRRGFAESGSSRGSFRRIVSRQRSAGLDFRAVKAAAKTKIKNCAKTTAQEIFLISRHHLQRKSSIEKRCTAIAGCATIKHALCCWSRGALRFPVRNHRPDKFGCGFR